MMMTGRVGNAGLDLLQQLQPRLARACGCPRAAPGPRRRGRVPPRASVAEAKLLNGICSRAGSFQHPADGAVIVNDPDRFHGLYLFAEEVIMHHLCEFRLQRQAHHENRSSRPALAPRSCRDGAGRNSGNRQTEAAAAFSAGNQRIEHAFEGCPAECPGRRR